MAHLQAPGRNSTPLLGLVHVPAMILVGYRGRGCSVTDLVLWPWGLRKQTPYYAVLEVLKRFSFLHRPGVALRHYVKVFWVFSDVSQFCLLSTTLNFRSRKSSFEAQCGEWIVEFFRKKKKTGAFKTLSKWDMQNKLCSPHITWDCLF